MRLFGVSLCTEGPQLLRKLFEALLFGAEERRRFGLPELRALDAFQLGLG